MMLAGMPLIAHHFDSKTVYSVIMQLEIENKGSKDSKETIGKGEWCNNFCTFIFYQSHDNVIKTDFLVIDDKAVKSFYPSVPTPPPNV